MVIDHYAITSRVHFVRSWDHGLHVIAKRSMGFRDHFMRSWTSCDRKAEYGVQGSFHEIMDPM